MNSKIFKAASVLAVVCCLVPSCSKTEGTEAKDNVMVFSASMPETKTAITKDGNAYKVKWKTGDMISVNGHKSAGLSSAYNNQRTGVFTIEGVIDPPYNVIYPGTTSANVIALPATQSYCADSFDPAAAAAYGTATPTGGDFGVSLNNFCGVLRFALKGSATLTRMEIKSLGSEKLRGNFTISNFETGAFTGGTAGTLTYNCPVTLTGSDTYFYVCIPAQTYASGLEALVYQSDGAYMRLKFWGDGHNLGSNVVEFESKTYAAGRTENLLQINSLTSESGGSPTVTPPSITVATYNVMRMEDSDRPANAISGEISRPADAIVKSCSAMQTALGQAIKKTYADVIGFQEINDVSYNTSKTYSIQNMAKAQGVSDDDYGWDLDWKSGSSSYHYCNGFAYNKNVLTFVESGKVWLREGSTSYSSSSSDGSGDPNRTVVWARFTHKVSGKQFYIFITQLPTTTQSGNTNMSGGVNAFAASKTAVNRRILVGDMNSNASNGNSAGYSKLKEYWTDAYEVMYAAHEAAGDLSSWFYYKYSGTQSGTGATYQYDILRYCKNHPERRLDHIMTQGNCTVQSYKTIRETFSFGSGEDEVECAPSDHLPVVCEISLDD